MSSLHPLVVAHNKKLEQEREILLRISPVAWVCPRMRQLKFAFLPRTNKQKKILPKKPRAMR